MKKLLIIWHSTTGGGEQMARAAAGGAAREAGVETRLLRAQQAQPADVLRADGLIFVLPENLASMSGLMKDFFDRCYYPLLGQIEGRAYAGLICAGADGEGAARQLVRIVTGWRLREVVPALIIRTGAQTQEIILAPKTIAQADLARCEERGAMLAAGLSIGMF